MPWWSIIYLVLVLLVIAAGTWLAIRDKEEKTFVHVLDILSAAICAYLFVSYWVDSWRQPLGVAAPILFVLALGWQLYDTPRGIRSTLENPDLSAREKQCLLVGITAFFLPIVVVAGMATFK